MNRYLLTHQDTKSPIAEAFRTLRTNLQFSFLGKDVKSLLVTSAGPGEGKSTVICNLAVALAQSGKRVVLVDTDLRRPMVHKALELDNDFGLTNMLINGPTEAAISNSEIPNLFVVTSGPIPPNPAELLESEKMDQVIAFLKQGADILLFDCPPVVAVTDAAIMSRKVDGVILVSRLGVTDRGALLHAKELLDQVGAKILGVVANGVSGVNGYGYYYYYYDSNTKGAKAGL